MGIETLIKRLNQYSQSLIAYKLGADFADACMDAATALEKLQAENERLRKELEYEREHANAYHEECGQWEAENEKLRAELECARESLDFARTKDAEIVRLGTELEQVKRERDAAQSLLAERIGVRGAEPITTAFGLPIDRLRELAQADREGRCVVLPPDDYTWTIRGDIIRGIIHANCRAAKKEAEAALQGEREEKQ